MEEKQSENFTVLDEFGKLKIFNSATEIIKYFVGFRLNFYQKRKDYLINKLTEELDILSNRARFIKMIIEKRLNINNVPKDEVIAKLHISFVNANSYLN
jgi:DNA topoisomerase-2